MDLRERMLADRYLLTKKTYLRVSGYGSRIHVAFRIVFASHDGKSVQSRTVLFAYHVRERNVPDHRSGCNRDRSALQSTCSVTVTVWSTVNTRSSLA